MADVQSLRTLRYDLGAIGALEDVIAPPYDVIDDALRAELAARSPFNVVEIDLPRPAEGRDPYLHAADTFQAWRQEGVLVQEREPALWLLQQEYTAPDGSERTRKGFFARVRVEDYGPGRIRPHERTHPGPKEDRLRLTRATRANMSPIFCLHPGATLVTGEGEPFADVTDPDGTRNRLWRVGDPDRIRAVQDALADAELLIADGHHRYETARTYADEIGGEGAHRQVLMNLVSMSDRGLAIFPTHRVVSGLDADRRRRLDELLERDFKLTEAEPEAAAPNGSGAPGFG